MLFGTELYSYDLILKISSLVFTSKFCDNVFVDFSVPLWMTCNLPEFYVANMSSERLACQLLGGKE